jgi:hypothetical protein
MNNEQLYTLGDLEQRTTVSYNDWLEHLSPVCAPPLAPLPRVVRAPPVVPVCATPRDVRVRAHPFRYATPLVMPLHALPPVCATPRAVRVRALPPVCALAPIPLLQIDQCPCAVN